MLLKDKRQKTKEAKSSVQTDTNYSRVPRYATHTRDGRDVIFFAQRILNTFTVQNPPWRSDNERR